MAIGKLEKKKKTTTTKAKRKCHKLISSLYSAAFHRPAPGTTAPPIKKQKKKKKKKRWSPLKIAATSCWFSIFSSSISKQNKNIKNTEKKKNNRRTSSRRKKGCHCNVDEEEIPLLHASSCLPAEDEKIIGSIIIDNSGFAEFDVDVVDPLPTSTELVPLKAGNDADHVECISESKDKEDSPGIEDELKWMMIVKKLAMTKKVNENNDDYYGLSDLKEVICFESDDNGDLVKMQVIARTVCSDDRNNARELKIDCEVDIGQVIAINGNDDDDDDNISCSPKSSEGELIMNNNVQKPGSTTSVVEVIVDDYESKNSDQSAIVVDSENETAEPSNIQSDDVEVKIIDKKKMFRQMIHAASMATMLTGIWFLSRISAI